MTAATIGRMRRASRARLVETLARLEDDASRQRVLARWPILVSATVAERLIEAARDRLRVDSRMSLALAQASESIGARLNDRRIVGQSRRAAGNALCVSGSARDSLAALERAVAAFEDLGDEHELARTLNAAIQPLILLGQYERALATATRARELFARQGDDLRLARLDVNIGNLLHRQDRFDEALACYEQALARLVPLGDTDGMLSALHNEGVTLTALNEFHRAVAAYQAARAICVEHQMVQATAQVDYNIAWLHYLRGEYSRALELLHAAAAFAKDVGDAYHEALSLLDVAEIYLELNLGAEARAAAEDARARFLRLGIGYEAAKALVSMAIADGRDGSTARAVERLAEARGQFVRENNRVWPSLVDLYQAILLFNLGRLSDARALCVTALEFLSTTALHSKTALCRLLLARIHLELGDPVQARSECEQVLERLPAADKPMLAYHARLVLGDVESEAGDSGRARAAYLAARDALEELRSRVRGEELKIAFVGNKLDVYERLIELCLAAPSSPRALDEVFAYVEQAKSRALLDLMSQPVHGLARADASDSPLAQSLREIRQELSWFYHRIELEQTRQEGPSASQIERLEREVALREQEFVRVLRALAVTDPRQRELQQPTVYSVDAIRAALPAHAVLLEYFAVRDRIFLCLLDGKDLSVVPVGSASQASRAVRMVQFQISKFRLSADRGETDGDALLRPLQHHLRGLFDQLLAPVWPLVQGRHLLVVPHGALHYVPFHALFDGEGYVLDSGTVSYAPSASVYARCHGQPRVESTTALVLGVPDARAPQIEAEAAAVAAALPGARLFLGADATGEVLRLHGGQSRIVHIAAHGAFRAENPMFSTLRLGDTYLSVHDLYYLNMPAELVTVSGCATGASLTAAGDELLGLTRGLFCAGAQGLLVSLWDVHDASTAMLMTQLYGRIANGMSTVDALREAMIDLRREHPHPFYWAPFVLTGKFWHV